MRNAVGSQLAGPVRRIAIASALIVVLVGATIGGIVLRFGASADKYETIVAVQPSSFATSDTRSVSTKVMWVRQLGSMIQEMVRITITPEWVGLLDFQVRFPSALPL